VQVDKSRLREEIKIIFSKHDKSFDLFGVPNIKKTVLGNSVVLVYFCIPQCSHFSIWTTMQIKMVINLPPLS
jgi:hypothetical protein